MVSEEQTSSRELGSGKLLTKRRFVHGWVINNIPAKYRRLSVYKDRY